MASKLSISWNFWAFEGKNELFTPILLNLTPTPPRFHPDFKSDDNQSSETYDFVRKNFINLFWKIENDMISDFFDSE